MIQIASQQSVTLEWHDVLLRMIPVIEACAERAFQHLRSEARAEAVQNALCCACSAVARLAERGRLDLCHPTVMARYAIAQTKAGRMLGRTLNCQDVASRHCQQRKGVIVDRLGQSQTYSPDELIVTRIDLSFWLATLNPRDRSVIQFFSIGHQANDVAKQFGLSEGRVSQLRRELYRSWCRYCDETLVKDV